MRKAREVARQETRGRVAPVRLEKWGKVQTMQPSLVTLRIWVFLLRAKGRCEGLEATERWAEPALEEDHTGCRVEKRLEGGKSDYLGTGQRLLS